MVLGLGIGIIGSGVAEHLARDIGVGVERARDALEMILPEGHERFGDEAAHWGCPGCRAVLRGELAEILVGARLVHLDAVAVRIHAAKLPDGARNTLLGGIFELYHRLVGLALAQRLGAGAERLER